MDQNSTLLEKYVIYYITKDEKSCKEKLMGLFMSSNKRVIVKNITANNHVQINVATTLSFYIIERIQETDITSIEYQVEKVSGRNSIVLTAWANVSMVGVENDIYTFDYTAATVTTADKIVFRFKVVDIDGIEYFIDINDIEIIS